MAWDIGADERTGDRYHRSQLEAALRGRRHKRTNMQLKRDNG